MQFPNFFSIENPKAIKARDFGYLNAINYMAPADTGGVGAGCKALCLGWYSGRAEMGGEKTAAPVNNARKSRVRKAQAFMKDRKAFYTEMVRHVAKANTKASRLGLKLCVRLNGATDIGWEGVGDTFGWNIFRKFPTEQFVDYTKNPKRAIAHAMGKFPANYHLTFSRSETNEADCKRVLAAGGNVAVVFEGEPENFPKTYLGHIVIDGTAHDLRHLDDYDENGRRRYNPVIVGLCPKGRAAKKDQSGVVVRAAA